MIKAPKSLSLESKRIWKEITTGWELDESGELLLKLALEALDEYRSAKRAIEKEGYILKSKSGVGHKHPAIEVMKIARGQFIQLWKQLHLDLQSPLEGPGRPPGS